MQPDALAAGALQQLCHPARETRAARRSAGSGRLLPSRAVAPRPPTPRPEPRAPQV